MSHNNSNRGNQGNQSNNSKSAADILAASIPTKQDANEQAAKDAEAKKLADEQAAKDAEAKKLADEQADEDARLKLNPHGYAVPERFLAVGEDGQIVDRMIRALIGLPGMADAIGDYLKVIASNEELEKIATPVIRASKLDLLGKALETELIQPITSIVEASGLALSDLEGKRLVVTFQDGKVNTAFSDRVKEVKASGGARGGERPDTIAFYKEEGSERIYNSAHEMAKELKLKYEGMSTSAKAVEEAETYASGAYMKADGTPLLISGGTAENEKHYIRTESKAKELGISLVGCILNGKKHHPFKFTLKETGTATKDGVTRRLITATRIETPLDETGKRIAG